MPPPAPSALYFITPERNTRSLMQLTCSYSILLLVLRVKLRAGRLSAMKDKIVESKKTVESKISTVESTLKGEISTVQSKIESKIESKIDDVQSKLLAEMGKIMSALEAAGMGDRNVLHAVSVQVLT